MSAEIFPQDIPPPGFPPSAILRTPGQFFPVSKCLALSPPPGGNLFSKSPWGGVPFPPQPIDYSFSLMYPLLPNRVGRFWSRLSLFFAFSGNYFVGPGFSLVPLIDFPKWTSLLIVYPPSTFLSGSRHITTPVVNPPFFGSPRV